MTDTNKPPLATGGMSRTGTTTVVKISEPTLDPADKKVLCSALCQCDKAPNVGKDGRQLKQACVAERMKALDTATRTPQPLQAGNQLRHDQAPACADHGQRR